MRARLLSTILISAALIPPAARFAAQNATAAANLDADTAKAFLTSVYKHYRDAGMGVDTVGPDAGRTFHSSLVALLRADQKAASPDVGAIDADPVCACQDWSGIWDLVIEVKIETPSRSTNQNTGQSTAQAAARATAKVSFYLSDPKSSPQDKSRNNTGDSMRTLSIQLAAENGAWRIYDIADQTDPTAPFALRKALQDDIAAHTRPR